MESIMTRKRKKGKLVALATSLIVLFFAVVMCMQIKDSRKELKELQRQEAKYQEQYEDEQKRATELEDRRVYVQTKQYVEEVAQSIGYVYPNQIVYKPEN